MVTEWVMTAFFTVWGWFWAAIPDPPEVPWTDIGTASDSFFSAIADLLPWAETFVPIHLAVTFLGLWLAGWAIAITVKIGRIVLSLLTLGGGM